MTGLEPAKPLGPHPSALPTELHPVNRIIRPSPFYHFFCTTLCVYVIVYSQGVITLTNNYASFWQRLGAVLIDGILLNVVTTLLFRGFSMAQGGADLSVTDTSIGISALLTWAYSVFMVVKYGATLGKMALKIRVQSETTGANLTYGEAILREVVGKFLSSILLGLGYLWVLWDPKKQGWHDKLGKSVVVKAN